MTPGDFNAAGPAFSPFGKVPVLEHDGRRLAETIAILQYVDEALDGPPLQPPDPFERARATMLQAAAVAYLYPTGVMGVFFLHAYIAANGGVPDPAKVSMAAQAAAPVLDRFEAAIGWPFAVGAGFSLADIQLVTMLENLAMAPIGVDLLRTRPRLAALTEQLRQRPSVVATREPIPLFGLPA